MRPRPRSGAMIVALAIAPVVAFQSAGAQSNCAPASRVSGIAVSSSADAGVMDRVVSLHGRSVSLREALDRLAAAAHIRLSYAAEQLDLARPVCLEYESAAVGRILGDLLEGALVKPVLVGNDQVVLAVIREHAARRSETVTTPMMKQVGLLDRVVVTGSTIGASQRSLPIALDVVGGLELSERGTGSISGALDGAVPGVWLWEQSPLSLLARYGSIRGASSFGVSYPKVYVDGIEVANSLLVTHFDPDAIARIEVIRGPQGAALYGADAISGVMNIITRQEGTEGGAPRVQLRTEGGATASDYSTGSVLAQTHGITLRSGTGVRSARLGITMSSIGAFIPNAFSQQLTANAGLRMVGSKSIVSGTFRFFSQDARTPSSPVLARLDLWSAPASPPGQGRMTVGAGGREMPGDTMKQRSLDSLSRLAITDSSGRQSVQQFTVGATGTFTNSERWTHTAIAGLDGYRLKSSTVLDGGFSSPIDSALRAATGNAIRTTLRASSVGQFGEPERTAATVTFGAEHSFVRDKTITSGPFARPNGEIGAGAQSLVETRSNAGLIGQVSGSFNERLYLTGGLRVERNTALDGLGDVAMLPMLGAATVRAFGPATVKFRAAYGKGIRPPQTSSTSGTLMGLQGYSARSTLAPEEQAGVEAGADLFYGRFMSLHVTRFDQRASGLIQPVSVYQSITDSVLHYTRIVYELQNVGEISNRGWELQGTLGNGPWSVGATFAQVDSKVRKLAQRYTGDLRPGDRMLEIPARTLGVNASYVHSRWSTAWSVTRASDWINYDRIALLSAFAGQDREPRDFVGPELRNYWIKYDGVTRVGGRVGLSLGRGMMFTLEGENLLDEQRGEPDNVTVLPGRTVSAGLKVRF